VNHSKEELFERPFGFGRYWQIVVGLSEMTSLERDCLDKNPESKEVLKILTEAWQFLESHDRRSAQMLKERIARLPDKPTLAPGSSFER
jgi:hypothetical protein